MTTQKALIFNSRERAVSSDFNQIQQFAAQERNDMIAAMLTPSKNRFSGIGQSVSYSGSANAPLPGYVLDGLLAVVDAASSGILINPGAVFVRPSDPTDANDSGWVLVESAGVQMTGQLVLAANGAASPRVDVIEFTVIQSTVTTASRDIYNPTTGLFVASVVTKVTKPTLSFRLRQGTAGSAPGYSAGYMPILIAVLQPSTDLAKVDYYDCRPLWREMMHESDVRTASTSGIPDLMYTPSEPIDANWTINGLSASPECDGVAVTRAMGVTLGGQLYRNTPCSNADFAVSTTGVAISAANAWKGASDLLPGAGGSHQDIMGLFAVLPDLGGGVPLPRFVRYSQTLNPRVPVGANGLLLWSNFKSLGTNNVGDKTNGGAITVSTASAVLGSGTGVLLAVTSIYSTAGQVLGAARSSIAGLMRQMSYGQGSAVNNAGIRTPGGTLAIHPNNTAAVYTAMSAWDGTAAYATMFRRYKVQAQLQFSSSASTPSFIEVFAYLVQSLTSTVSGVPRITLGSRQVAQLPSVSALFEWDLDIEGEGWSNVSGASNWYLVFEGVAADGSTATITASASNIRITGLATN